MMLFKTLRLQTKTRRHLSAMAAIGLAATLWAGAQVPINWYAVVDGGLYGPDQFMDVAVADNGDVAVAGWTRGQVVSDDSDWDFITVRFDAAGREKWRARYNHSYPGQDVGERLDQAHWVGVDDAGNTYTAGQSWGGHTSVGGTEHDYVVIKYGPSGNVLWTRRYDGPGDGSVLGANADLLSDMHVDDAGNVYLAGFSYVAPSTNGTYATHLHLLKYDTNGEIVWQHHLDGSPHNGAGAKDLFVDAGGNVYATGSMSVLSGNSSTDHAYTVKVNATGQVVFAASYAGTQGETVTADGSGNTFVSGTIYNPNTSGADLLTLKYSPTGQLLWAKTKAFEPGEGHEPSDSVADVHGNVYVVGYLGHTAGGNGIIVSYGPTGAERWSDVYDENWDSDEQEYMHVRIGSDGTVFVDAMSDIDAGSYRPTSDAVPPPGGTLLTGYKQGSGHDFVVFRYSSTGLLLGRDTLDLSHTDNPRGFALDPDNNAFVAGYTWKDGTADGALVRFGAGGSANLPPMVRLVAPDAQSSFSPGSSFDIVAEAWDGEGSVQSVDFYDGPFLIGRDTTSPYSVTWSTTVTGNHVLTARAVDDSGHGRTSEQLTITVGAGGGNLVLPYPWASTDVGSTGAAGNAYATKTSFTVYGSGADVWGTSDAFHFLYQPMTGDGELVAQVTDVQNVNAWTKAGVMFRSSLAAGASHGFMLVSPGNGLAFQRRTTDAGQSMSTAGPGGAAPYWVKLARRGSQLTASVSTDGSTWNVVGTDTVALGPTAYIGLATSSHVPGTLAYANFSNVQITQAIGSPGDTTLPVVSLAAPLNGATVSAAVTISANASDDTGVAAVRFALDGAPIGADDTNAPYSISWDSRETANGAHTLSATAFDAAGNSSSSSITVTVSNTSTGGPTPFTGTPVTLPGRIEIENFDNGGSNVAYFDTTAGNRGGVYRDTDVDLEPTSDTGGGFNLAKVRAAEWMKYSVTVATAGTYALRVRVASAGMGGTFRVESEGMDLTGPLTVPDTGGWQNWTTVTTTVTLAAGQQVLRFVVDGESAAGFGNVNWIEFASTSTQPTPGGSTPFSDTAAALPGRIEAENFDNGGANVAYFDTTAGNRGGVYRNTDVDLEATSDAGGGYNIAKIRATEWLKYTVDVAAGGTYTLRVRLASVGAGGRFHLESNGVDLTGPLTVPDTGGWQTWATLSTPVTLAAGQQVLRLVVDSESGSGFGNVNWLEIASASTIPTGSTPYSGTPVPMPGRIEAENFDNGDANVAFVDTTAVNEGGAYRQTPVDLEPTTDVGDGHNVGWLRVGEWLNYTVSVPTTGTYTLRVRVAAEGAGGRIHIESKGIDRTGSITIPNTGSWQAWTTVTTTITLPAGEHVLRLVVDEDTAGVVGNINWFELASR